MEYNHRLRDFNTDKIDLENETGQRGFLRSSCAYSARKNLEQWYEQRKRGSTRSKAVYKGLGY